MTPSWTGRNLQDFKSPPCLTFSPLLLAWIPLGIKRKLGQSPAPGYVLAQCKLWWEFVNSQPLLSTIQKWDLVKQRAVLKRMPPSSNENCDRGGIQGSAGHWCLREHTSDQPMCIQRNLWEGYCSVLACKLNLETAHYQAFFQVFSCINKSNVLFERYLLTWIFLVLSMVTCFGTIV